MSEQRTTIHLEQALEAERERIAELEAELSELRGALEGVNSLNGEETEEEVCKRWGRAGQALSLPHAKDAAERAKRRDGLLRECLETQDLLLDDDLKDRLRAEIGKDGDV